MIQNSSVVRIAAACLLLGSAAFAEGPALSQLKDAAGTPSLGVAAASQASAVPTPIVRRPKAAFWIDGGPITSAAPAQTGLPESASISLFGRPGGPQSLKALMGLKFDSDVPADIQQQMVDDLNFIQTIQGNGATPLHQKIFGQMDGTTYIQFFDSRVKSVGLNDCGNGNAVACVIPFYDASKMWLTQNYIKFSHPQIARLMVVFHESRHTETLHGNWPHANCPTPFQDANGNDMKSIWTGAPLAGEPACDTTPLGSYGSSTIMLKNVQKFCANCTDKVKMDAGIYADDQIHRIIDQGAIDQMQKDLYGN